MSLAIQSHRSIFRPCIARIQQRDRLSKPGSNSDVTLIVLDIRGTGISYAPGDTIGIFPKSNFWMLDQVLHYSKTKDSCPSQKYDERTLLINFLKAIERDINEEEASFSEIFHLLTPVSPRFYSISSSQKFVGDEIHLTIASSQEKMLTSPSSHLCHIAPIQSKVNFFIYPQNGFSLPSDDQSIIMIGAGSGIAPFRGFMQERLITRSKGKNWLFFGGRSREHDFLFEEFWTDLEKKGFLTIDTVFTSDHKQKVYIDSLMCKKGRELFEWIQRGATVYVCGNAEKLARSTESALLSLIKNHGMLNTKQSQNYLQKMRNEKRFLLSVN